MGTTDKADNKPQNKQVKVTSKCLFITLGYFRSSTQVSKGETRFNSKLR